MAEPVDGNGTHSQNSFNVGLPSLLPADAAQSPKVILSESRHEKTTTDGGTQVAREIIVRRKRISRGLRKRTTTRRGRVGRPGPQEIEHQFTGWRTCYLPSVTHFILKTGAEKRGTIFVKPELVSLTNWKTGERLRRIKCSTSDMKPYRHNGFASQGCDTINGCSSKTG